MAEIALVENQIEDAGLLVEKLDQDGFSTKLVAWYYYSDAEEWRLLISGNTFDSLLQKQEAVAYGRLAQALNEITVSGLKISDLKIVGTSAPLVQSIGRLIKTGTSGVIRAHFANTTINGIFMKEFFVLRST